MSIKKDIKYGLNLYFFKLPILWHEYLSICRTDISVTVETQIPKVSGSSGTFVAVRVDQGGCNAWEAKGIFLFILPDQQKFVLANDLCKWSCIYISKILFCIWFKCPFYSELFKILASHFLLLFSNEFKCIFILAFRF